MARISTAAILLIALLLAIPGALAADCSVVVDQYEVQAGDTIQVPVRILDGANIGSIDLKFTFDPALISVESTHDDVFDNYDVNLEDSDLGVVRLVAFQSINPGLDGDFTILTINFKALKAGESKLDIEIASLIDANPQLDPVNHTISDGKIVILQTDSGDGSGDKHGGGGGGGGFIPSKINTDSQGKVKSTYTEESSDGKAKLIIPEGTVALDADGEPLGSVSISSTQVGGTIYACNLGPNGATFDPKVTLVFEFDPGAVPEGETVVVKVWDGTEWAPLKTTVDFSTNTATVKVSHFTVFALFTEMKMSTLTPAYTSESKSTISPTASPTIVQPLEEPPVIPWFFIVASIIAIALVLGLVMNYRKNRSEPLKRFK
ncbi:MAG: cohesin domain-containing protein [Halobacteriota archaeon]|nr:cohesin domain-containing protein [Halobacteriota archaeon]